MDVATASLIFLDRIEKDLSELIKQVTGGGLEAAMPDLGKVLADALAPTLSMLETHGKNSGDVLTAIRAAVEKTGGDGAEKLLPSIAALQNAVTISANRSAAEIKNAVAPIVDSQRNLQAVLERQVAELSRRRTYKLKIDRNHQTKLIQDVEISEVDKDKEN